MAPRLAVLPNWLGDLVMAEPAVRIWAEGRALVAVVDPALAPLVADAGLADAVEVYDRRGVDRGLRGLVRRGRALRRHGSEEALVLGPSLRAAALAAAAGARVRRGLGGEGREFFLTQVHRPGVPARTEHLVDTWFSMASGEIGRTRAPRPRWRVGPEGRRGWRSLRERFGALDARRFAVFGAGASFGPAKQWDPDRFAALAVRLREDLDLLPVFVGSAAPRESELAGRLAERSAGLSLAGHTDLPTLAAVLEAASVFVGNDSGPMHLAAAIGTPTVGIFGSTSPAWTAPRGALARTVGPAPVVCTPCFRRTCPYARECLTGIAVSDVREVVDEVLVPRSSVHDGEERVR